MTTQFGNDPTYALGNTNQVRVVITANGSELRPLLTVKASSETISEGSSVTFTVRTSVKSNRDIQFNVTLSGNSSQDVDFLTPDRDTYTINAGNYSVDVQIQIRRDNTVEPDETLVLTLNSDTPPAGKTDRYFLGTPTVAEVTIESDDLPELSLVGGGTVAEGGTGSFRIVADTPVTKDTSVNYQLSGTAQNGADYRALSGTIIMKAGSSSVTVPINVINDDVIFKPSDMLVAEWPAYRQS